MSEPILISDGEDQGTPLPSLSKKLRTGLDPVAAILISDTDTTPQKQPPDSASTPSFVAETPFSDDVSVVKCSIGSGAEASNPDCEEKFSGKRVISLESESENESENNSRPKNPKENEPVHAGFDEAHHVLDSRSDLADSDKTNYALDTRMCEPVTSYEERVFSIYSRMKGRCSLSDYNANWMQETGFYPSLSTTYFSDDAIEIQEDAEQNKENISIEQMGVRKQTRKHKTTALTGEALAKKKMTKEEKIRAMEEKKLKKEQERLQKTALKAEEAERKNLEKEKQKWEKGKLALKSIVAEIDAKVVELGSVGGHLLSRFSDKGITFRITSNPIERSIVWKMTVPEHISQLLPQGPKIPYVLLVFEADEFCDLVANEKLLEHVSRVRSQHPSYTVCYLTNKLMAYANKREKEQYKNPENCSSWRRPPIEEVLAKLTTHYARVHSRHCVDEAELAEHVVGLTSSLASCQFRKKLTRLSVNANGSIIPKDSVDKHLIKKSPWLKALIAIPKVQPRFALAVWKKYPTMKSLLKVYMDPNKSVHEKEFLLKDLTVEGLVGSDRRLGEICSKRIHRVLMAQSGNIKTDDVEVGADFFRHSED